MKHNRALILLGLGGWLACSSPGTQITEEDVLSANRNGKLENLYRRVSADLEAEGSRKSPHSLAMKARIGGLLGEKVAEEILGGLEEKRDENGLLPLADVEGAELRIADAAHYDESQAQRLRTRLTQERERSAGAIQSALEARGQLGDDATAEKVALTAQAMALAAPGSDQARALEAERSAYLAELTAGVDRALQSEDLEAAEQMARVANEMAPDNIAVQEQVAAVDAKLFEKQFWKQLEEGDPSSAYAMLEKASTAPNFGAVSKRLKPYARDMSDAISRFAADQAQAGNLPSAYAGFHQARGLRKMLGVSDPGQLPAENAFVEKMKKRYWKARKAKQPGLAWGYLEVVTELEVMSPPLRRLVRETREEVEQVAVKRLAAQPFHASGSGSEFGEGVSSKIIQILFQQIPQDIRIIEREQLEDVLREKEIGKQTGELAAADYIVQGDIQEARVESTEKVGKKTMRVVTQTVTEPNPRYDTWLGMSKRDRSDIAEPPKNRTVTKEEDVTVETTVHRKVGVFSVSYRLVDADSAKVIFADSLHEKAQHDDTSTEGVQLGDFELEFKMASLPSDLEILQQLSDTVSKVIGERLVEVLANPELKYEEAGRRYEEEGNYSEASESLAYAHVLSERKGKDTEEISRRLRAAAVRAVGS